MPIPARFVKFCIVGFSGVIVDMARVLDPLRIARWPIAAAKCVSTEAAILNNFLWNDLLDVRGPGGARRRRAGAAQAPLHLQRHLRRRPDAQPAAALHPDLGAGVNRYVANGVAILLVTGWNFGMNRAFSWGVPAPQRGAERMKASSPGTDTVAWRRRGAKSRGEGPMRRTAFAVDEVRPPIAVALPAAAARTRELVWPALVAAASLAAITPLWSASSFPSRTRPSTSPRSGCCRFPRPGAGFERWFRST